MMNELITTAYVSLYVKIRFALVSLLRDQRGVTAIEYAIIAVAMATFLAVVLGDRDSATSFLGQLQATFNAIAGALSKMNSTPVSSK